MRTLTLSVLALVLTLGGAAYAWRHATTTGDRPDCPGKIICPLTGEWVCKDRCPLGAAPAAKSTTPDCCRIKK